MGQVRGGVSEAHDQAGGNDVDAAPIRAGKLPPTRIHGAAHFECARLRALSFPEPAPARTEPAAGGGAESAGRPAHSKT